MSEPQYVEAMREEIARLRADLEHNAEVCRSCERASKVEVEHLRAEVERLKRLDAANDFVADSLERERDEVLAQVAVLLQRCHDHHTSAYDLLKDCPICQDLDISREARALLDRLDALERSEEEFKVKWKRAEAVVEAVDTFIRTKKHVFGYGPDKTFGLMNHPHATEWIQEYIALQKALAAWEEGKT